MFVHGTAKIAKTWMMMRASPCAMALQSALIMRKQQLSFPAVLAYSGDAAAGAAAIDADYNRFVEKKVRSLQHDTKRMYSAGDYCGALAAAEECCKFVS